MPFREGATVNEIYALLKQRLRAKNEAQRQHAEAAIRELWEFPSVCLYWKCEKPPRSQHVLCNRHYGQLQKGLINLCPTCDHAKDARYKVCAECYDKQHERPSNAPVKQQYSSEHSKAWAKGDATADHFFVYILRLDGGKFYAGQTRELRERLSEHRDGQTQSTAGKNPKLVWYGMLATREQAAAREVEL